VELDEVERLRQVTAVAIRPNANRADASVVTGVRIRPVVVPLDPPLRTASGVMATAPLVLVDITTDKAVVGRAYVFTYTPSVLPTLARLAEAISGQLVGQPVAPKVVVDRIRRRLALLGTAGLMDMALAGLDMALWDAHARGLGLSLVRLLGGEPKPLRAYASFGMDGLQRAVAVAATSVDAGFRAIKVKIGYPALREDLAVVRGIRQVIGPDVDLMVDYNQSLTVPEAIRRGHALDDEGIAWIEEPTRCDDLDGHARVADAIKTPLQLGENAWGPRGLMAILSRRASDLAMADLVKVGGVTGWLDAVSICEAGGVPLSNHFYQEMSAHMLALTPVAHYLEYFGIADAVLVRPLVPVAGVVEADDKPGNGIEWNEDAIARHRLL
jgi:mandelate racemase